MNANRTLVIFSAALSLSISATLGETDTHQRGLSPCPQEPTLQNWTPTAFTPFPNFVPGEQAGAVLVAPSDDYPIEILRIEIEWASNFGGAPTQLEQAIHIYPAGLPNQGAAQFTLPGPSLVDGVTNVFDISGMAGNKIINSGPFTVAIEFLNQSSGNPFAPSVVADQDSCQLGKNAIFTIPGGWSDACQAGVTGDWVISVVYRRVNCDCNSNGVFDDDDISAATSSDCNTNSIPDECDISAASSSDCNTTGVPDECELGAGDCNSNGVPDGCESDFDGDDLIDDCDPDIDADGIANGLDACDFTPPGANIVTNPQDPLYGTLRHDSDGDCDCDLVDFARFQMDFTGSNPGDLGEDLMEIGGTRNNGEEDTGDEDSDKKRGDLSDKIFGENK